MPDANLDNALKKELTIKYNEQEFTFKIPSIKDRLSILNTALKLRRDTDPDGTGVGSGNDPSLVVTTEILATFMVLLLRTSASWVYSPDAHGKPVINLDNWPDNTPVMEVVDQFNQELAKFRAGGN